MKSQKEIRQKIEEVNKILTSLNEKQDAEMKKAIPARELSLLIFIYKERMVYEFALSQLEWILAD